MTVFRDYQAPPQDRGTFVDPPWWQGGSLLHNNETQLAEHPRWLRTLRQRARFETIEAAKRYTSAYRDVSWVDGRDASRVLMAGHQPTLFHPGVWFKNFALSHLAAQHGAVALNLVVDNDVAGGSSIRVPTKDPATGQIGRKTISYDSAGGGLPYEQMEIRDRASFESFGERVSETVQPFVDAPTIERLWPHAIKAIGRCGFAGCALAQARHALEAELGQVTLEVPVGVVSRTASFAEFVARLLIDARRAAGCYNDSNAQYRAAHGIRSTAHPVPDLAIEDEWVEMPFWVYGDDSPTRQRVWTRTLGDQIEIGDRQNRSLLIHGDDIESIGNQLLEKTGPNFKIRPRALITTMFSRLVLSDLFLHGIGGGKYDQLGDLICRRFFHLKPPSFLVISATVFWDHSVGDGADEKRRTSQTRRRIRDTQYQPETFASDVELPESLIRRKRELIEQIPPRGEKKAWHDELTEINGQLSLFLEDKRSSLRDVLASQERRLMESNWLRSREHSFAIHGLNDLVGDFRNMLSSLSQTSR